MVDALRAGIPDDGILVCDTTTVAYMCHMYYPVYAPRTYLSTSYMGTLGFGYPIVLQRIWRFGAANFLIHGQLDGTVIEQSRLLPPRLGEGWLEVLDPGII
jgi:hypothetical protein